MLLGVIDTETTGLDPTKDTITELAWALFDTEERQVVASASFMFPTEVVSEEITKITKITSNTTKRVDLVREAMVLSFEAMNRADVYVAHNALFDKGFIERLGGLPAKKWVCSYQDLEFGIKPGKLTHMCCDLGLPVSGAHRAINDVLMLCAMLANCPDLPEQIVKILTYKKYMVIANVSYAENQLAKDMGCRWDPTTKVWHKTVRAASDAEVKAMQWPCKVTIKEMPENG
jgi:DNA polymerase-3 subunit epsilon